VSRTPPWPDCDILEKVAWINTFGENPDGDIICHVTSHGRPESECDPNECTVTLTYHYKDQGEWHQVPADWTSRNTGTGFIPPGDYQTYHHFHRDISGGEPCDPNVEDFWAADSENTGDAVGDKHYDHATYDCD